MEILTIMKANIRYKKGSFMSIILLMTIISMALTAILSVWDNIYEGVNEAQARVNTADVVCMVNREMLSDDLIAEVERHELVKSVKLEEAIASWNVSYDGAVYSNPVYIRELPSGYRLFHSERSGFFEETQELNHGEIYIPQGLKTNFSCETGDILAIATDGGSYEFRIKGIIEEPQMGASVIGWKNVFLSHADYQNMCEELEGAGRRADGISSFLTFVSVYKNEDCLLTDGRFARQINLDTGIADMSSGAITREMMAMYTCLFPKIICMILIVFVILLLVSVVVVLCHSVSTGIDMEYTVFGIMKAQGFTTEKMQAVFVIQYVAAEILGSVIGILAAIPLCRTLGDLFLPITGIIPQHGISIGKSGGILLMVLMISVICILLITRKIARISPVKAIAGIKKEIYFDSRIQAAVSKKLLSASLAFRQFTSDKKQYAGVIAIVGILVYFMTTMMVLTNVITATSAWDAMGIAYADLDIELKESVSDAKIRRVEEMIRHNTNFQVSYKSCGNYYMSINGEQIMACIYDEAEYIKAITKGRIPLYDNEIIVTEIAADNLGLKIGDKVSVGCRDRKETYIISGFNQFMNDAGVNFSMTKSAASKLDDMHLSYLGYILEDQSQGAGIEEELNRQFGEILTASYDETSMDSTYQLAIHAMTLVVYIFSAIFALVTVHMVCSKAFLKERRDIGIYKALGFTSTRLRLQFAVRFFMVAVLGAAAGSVAAAVFTGNMLSCILRLVGISSFQVTFRAATFAVPTVLTSVCFFLFAFLSSAKIKKVEVRELITE